MKASKSTEFILCFGLLIFVKGIHTKIKRSIDLAASTSLAFDSRLPKDITPKNYEIHLRPDIEENYFSGIIKMNLSWNKPTKKIMLHAHHHLNIDDRKIKIRPLNSKNDDQKLLQDNYILRGGRLPKKTVYVIYLKNAFEQGYECELEMEFEGSILENTVSLFKGYYYNSITHRNESYLATHMNPNNARRLFPCFDEPSFKVPYTVSISRPRDYVVLFNTPLVNSTEMVTKEGYMIDYFQTTPPMASFTFGFIISKIENVTPENMITNMKSIDINIWATDKLIDSFQINSIFRKLLNSFEYIEEFFNASIPLPKIDFVLISGTTANTPTNNWGLILLNQAELVNEGYYAISQELIHQWLGCWVTPYWWDDAHINKALASFISADIVMKVDPRFEFEGKYPMTILYSIYYEFSKRYPHSRITAMKQETNSYKTELVLRMLNHTLGNGTFKSAIRKLIITCSFSTFLGNDFWDSLTEFAVADGSLKSNYNVSEIATSWITKDRLPFVTIQRDYSQNIATVVQKMYLRERPHDVPDQDKMLWWIPLILNREDKLNFNNMTPLLWMENQREIKIFNLPDANTFIILNPEEIAPFPVNYDERNWNMLAQYLQTKTGRDKIPKYTKAKLLHDAWNLAYAGHLNFATALNMTVFMKHERNHVVWNPVFTFVDQIGRHIDMSPVHTKFELYIKNLLTPIYEELGEENITEENWKTDLRSLTKTFLCRVGYSPCIEESQKAFEFWRNNSYTDFDKPIPTKHLCPTFKWGSIQEWQFGLDSFINYPKTRIQSERTFLLKALAGCPKDPERINHLLRLTILEGNENVTDNDIDLIFRSLAGGYVGYSTLFNFLTENWTFIRQKFENKTNLWDSIIRSSTQNFKTQEGYDMVKSLYKNHTGHFGSAERIIENSLKNIKEEAIWSSQNLPVIENWLNNFFNPHTQLQQ